MAVPSAGMGAADEAELVGEVFILENRSCNSFCEVYDDIPPVELEPVACGPESALWMPRLGTDTPALPRRSMALVFPADTSPFEEE